MPDAPEIVGHEYAIPLAAIQVGQRLRPVDPVWAAALGAVMAAEGQKTAIEVCQLPGRKDYVLVSGGHRLEGARLQGWKTIRAVIVDANAIERREREVSENIWRKGLNPIDRAAFVAELHELLKIKAGVDPAAKPQQVAINARWQQVAKADATDTADMMSAVYGFTAEIGAQLGLTDRTIRRDLELHRRLLPDVVEALRGHPALENAAQLRALAKCSEADQRSAAAMILDHSAKTPTEALAMINQKPVLDPDQKAWSAFFGSWSRMSAVKRRLALKELAEQGLPKGARITFDDEDGQ